MQAPAGNDNDEKAGPTKVSRALRGLIWVGTAFASLDTILEVTSSLQSLL